MMDAIDEKILQTLESDGRISNIDLAARVGLSASACLRRVQALERSGVIAGYKAVIDRSKVGIDFVAYLAVGLNRHTKGVQEKFERTVARVPEVRECHNVTGTVEYLLRVETTSLAAYKTVHTDVLGALEDVVSITTYVLLHTAKDRL